YGLNAIADFNEFNEIVNLQPKPGRSFKLAGLVTGAQHRVSKNGHKFGVLNVEDYSGKMELLLWRDDYVRLSNYLEVGMVICISGSFQQRFATSPWEFKVSGITLLETLMRAGTKKLQIEMNAEDVTPTFVDFIEDNVRKHPGDCTLKFCITHPKEKLKFGMYTLGHGFEMNDEMAHYLKEKPELEVQVELT